MSCTSTNYIIQIGLDFLLDLLHLPYYTSAITAKVSYFLEAFSKEEYLKRPEKKIKESPDFSPCIVQPYSPPVL